MGNQTVRLERPVHIISTSCIAGPKEGSGPLGLYYDAVIDDELWGEKSWEKAESKFIRETFARIINKSGKSVGEVQYIIAGDLLNQCTATTFGLREAQIPMLGVYGACSTMGESMGIGAMLIDGGFAENVVCITSSHFCSAEKQFRFPLELGTQRCPTAQWTVTGSGGVMLSSSGNGPVITEITNGKIVDMGIKDANNMGAAMAPAAVNTLQAHFNDTDKTPEYYDLVATGDLGIVGKTVCEDIMYEDGFDLKGIYNDCGLMIFDREKQDVHAGGSGCGCSALVFCGYIYKQLKTGVYKNVLLVPTGALLSPTTTQQGESIPGIAHAVSVASTFVQ